MGDDALLQQNVQDELRWRPEIDAAHIGITAEAGVVTLTGYVRSYVEKRAVEDAVKRVIGGRGMAEDLQVRLEQGDTNSDAEITRRALAALGWNALVPAESVRVTVEQGLVLLTGTVSWQYQRSAAEDAVRSLSGVVGVRNEVSLDAQPQPEDIAQRIGSALRRSATIDAEGIRISVTEGAVSLDGTVGSWRNGPISKASCGPHPVCVQCVTTCAWFAEPGAASGNGRCARGLGPGASSGSGAVNVWRLYCRRRSLKRRLQTLGQREHPWKKTKKIACL